MYSVYTEDGYADLWELKEHMDMSVYPTDSPFYSPENKKVIGKFSDEKPGHIIKEVIALKPKMYSILAEELPSSSPTEKDHFMAAKGVSKAAQKNISHEDYRSVLEGRGTTSCDMRSIRSFNHKLFTLTINKRCLSAYDDKKFIMEDGVHTLCYGHFRIKQIEESSKL